ncbi:MAG TPA: hypothetical protein VMV49_15450 [Candidatus Deferrimicrobium sp.]|nr:hypothetical protein [Candidatus Deferrimicrobium sp.]
MNRVRVVGGILTILGGIFIVITCFFVLEAVLSSPQTELLVAWIINLIIALLAIIGGLLGVASKKFGGGFALTAGITAISIWNLGLLFNCANASAIFVDSIHFTKYFVSRYNHRWNFYFHWRINYYFYKKGIILILTDS